MAKNDCNRFKLYALLNNNVMVHNLIPPVERGGSLSALIYSAILANS